MITSEPWSGSAYCVTCKDNVEFIGSVKSTDSGRQMAHGRCPRCETLVNRILRKDT